jgi:TonB family protein
MVDYTSPVLREGYVYPPAFRDQPFSDTDTTNQTLSVALGALTDKINSGELTIDDLLQRIAEQSCLLSGASSAALALASPAHNAVICRASHGASAPPLGARLNAYSGLSGQCLRSGRLLYCDDAETDLRVDPLVCRQLGIRSIVALPLRDEHSTVGILEVFSDCPAAFNEQHVQALENLAYFARAAITSPPATAATIPGPYFPEPERQELSRLVRAAEADDDSLLFAQPAEHQGWLSSLSAHLHWTVAASLASIVLLALSALTLFIWMWRHTDRVESSTAKAPVVVAQERPAASQPAESGSLLTVSTPVRMKPEAGVRSFSHFKPPKENAASVIKVISPHEAAEPTAARLEPPKTATAEPTADNDPPPPTLVSNMQPSSGLMRGALSVPTSLPEVVRPVSEGIVPGKLEHQVAPVYPKQARQMRIEGPVRLRAVIGADGKVRDISVVKGDPTLAQAAKEAVSQWRYKPYELNHKPVAISTDITIDFKLR